MNVSPAMWAAVIPVAFVIMCLVIPVAIRNQKIIEGRKIAKRQREQHYVELYEKSRGKNE